MALTRFVRNVEDLSDDGGYKFRFHCDSCSDGVESQYKRSSANVLKTGVQVFQIMRNFWWGSTAVDGLDRGLRGKERDAAYEKAVGEASVFFTKCSHCGNLVCDHCWNGIAGLCEHCAPDSDEAAAIAAAAVHRENLVLQAQQSAHQGQQRIGQITCPVCSRESGGGRFCQHCGTSVASRTGCRECGQDLPPSARFCLNCGTPAA